MNAAVRWLEQEFDSIWRIAGVQFVANVGGEKVWYFQVQGWNYQTPPIMTLKEQNGEMGDQVNG